MRATSLLYLLFTGSLLAQLSFEHNEKSIHLLPDQEKATVTFPFKTVKDCEITLTETCSCLSTEITDNKLHWKTGERGEITFILDTTMMRGTNTKSLIIDTKGHPAQALSVKSIIPRPVSISPKNQKWKKGEPATEKTFLLTIEKSLQVHPTSVSASNPNFHYQLTELAPTETEKQYAIRVTPKDTSQTSYCLFKIKTDSDIKRYQSVSVIGLVK